MGVLINGSPFSGTSTTLAVYKYEIISYILTASGGDTSVTLISATTLIRALVAQVGDEVHFEAPAGYSGNVSSAESIVVKSVPGDVTYTIGVTIGAGRFILTPPLTSFTFNKNTRVEDTYGTSILFTSPIPISLPRSLTILPPGVGFVQLNSSNFYLTGTPLTTSPSTSYNIIGFGTPDTSKVISKTITITVNDEVITTSLAGGSNVSGMIVDFPIGERVITSAYPNRFAGNLVYSWNTLPDGIRFIDLSGNTVSSGFAPLDVNSTIRLVGVPSLTAAYSFASLSLSNYPVTVRATRQTTPQLTSSVVLNFSFAETVLFDPVSNVSVYTNAPIPFGTIPFTARTYFSSSPVGMQFIVAAAGLPAGLVLSHTAGSSNAYLTGTSTGAGAGTYTLTAQNSNGVYRDVSVNIAISTDSVQFVSSSPIQDVSYSFIISRPLNQAKTSYYPGSIQYTATAASGSAITYSTANLPSGVTATTSGGSLTLTGIPDTIQSLQTAVITATAASTGADLSRNMNYRVLADTMVVSPTSGFSFFQNQTINRTQFTGTTLSERLITTWTSPDLPDGLSLSSTGFLAGSPINATSGNATFTVVSSTGYYSQNNTITYKTIGDNALVLLNTNPTVTTDVFSNVPISVIAYSAKPVTTFVSNILPPQNPPISLSTNALSTSISGDVTTAGSVYPEYEFSIYTQVSNVTIDEQKFRLTTQTPSTPLHYILDVSVTGGYVQPTGSTPLIFPTGVPKLFKNVTSAITASNWINETPTLTSSNFGYLSDFDHSKNRIVLVAGSEMFRTTDISATGQDLFEKIGVGDISSLPDIVGDYSNVPSYSVYTSPGPLLMSIATNRNSNWLVAGQGFDSNTGTEYSIIRTSSNDGQTWVDISLSPFVVRSSNTSLYYNNGRYFLSQPSSLYYAEENSPAIWSNTGVSIDASGGSMAFSNNTVLVNDICGGVLVSSNNGTSWSPLTPTPVSTGLGARKLAYGLGTWVACMTDLVGGSTTYISISNSNTVAVGSNWSSEAVSTGRVDGIDFDGSYFMMSLATGDSSRNMFVDNVPFSLTSNEFATNSSIVFTRRMRSRLIGYSNAAVTISTISNSATFIDPSKSSYTLFQYVGANIPIELSPQSNFIYYYGSNLPQGLRIALDPSGVFADISGVPSRFSDGFQSSTIYARIPQTDTVAGFPISFRVLVPFVMKKQDGASGYTAFLRQYVTVNGAQASRDSVALPVETRPIGEFMHPGAPMVITDSNCPC